MATHVLIVFSLCLLACGVFSKAVAYDSELVQSTYSADTLALKRTIKLDAMTVLKLMRSLDSDAVVRILTDGVNRDRRVKRESIRGSGCPSQYIFYMKKCVPFEV